MHPTIYTEDLVLVPHLELPALDDPELSRTAMTSIVQDDTEPVRKTVAKVDEQFAQKKTVTKEQENDVLVEVFLKVAEHLHDRIKWSIRRENLHAAGKIIKGDMYVKSSQPLINVLYRGLSNTLSRGLDNALCGGLHNALYRGLHNALYRG